jgi:hypothetical protein
VAFNQNDRIIAILDNASTTVFSANWFKEDYTDQVQSVAGRTGAVSLAVADLTDMSANARTFNQAANYAAMRAALSLVVGTNVQAFSAYLATISGLTLTGNAGKVLTVNAGGTDFELDPVSSGGMTLIGTLNPNGVTTADFTSIPAGYKYFILMSYFAGTYGATITLAVATTGTTYGGAQNITSGTGSNLQAVSTVYDNTQATKLHSSLSSGGQLFSNLTGSIAAAITAMRITAATAMAAGTVLQLYGVK